jgi:hypothetical protein
MYLPTGVYVKVEEAMCAAYAYKKTLNEQL